MQWTAGVLVWSFGIRWFGIVRDLAVLEEGGASLTAINAPEGLHDHAVMALALGWQRVQCRPRLLDLPERLEVRAKLDRQLGPEAARSAMGEMTRQYLGNAMLRRGWQR